MAEGGDAQPNQPTLANIRMPPPLNISEGNVSENFKAWKRQIEIYLKASGARNMTPDVQTAIILHCAGSHILKIYDQFVWDAEGDNDDPEKLLTKLEAYCNPRKSEVLESYRFWNVEYQEPFDTFLTELRTRVTACNFKEDDRMIRDKIVFTVTGKLQELLLREDDLDLKKAVKICRAYEQSNKQVKEIRDTKAANTQRVNKVNREQKKVPTKNRQPEKPPTKPPPTNKLGKTANKPCKFCGTVHEWKKEKCPAWGKRCDLCHGRNHFRVKCKKVHSVSSHDQDDDDSDDYWLAAINSKPKDVVTAVMSVNNCDVRFQLDSAADVNTICKKFVKKKQVRPTKANLRMWNKSHLKPLGEADLEVTNQRTGEKHTVTFIVVPSNLMCLLGLRTIQKMGLVTINNEKFIASVSSHTEQLGDLGEAKLTVDPSIQPKALPSRKLPLSLRDRVKAELHTLVERGILIPVSKPTRWVSQMAVVHKPNNKLRICIDPQPLNTALLREHYKLPVLDDIRPKLQNAKIFSKFDVKEAYWHVRLDEESSELTTMITPFGRFRWARLPFGLKVSGEIFQRKLDEALGDLDGILPVIDDIIVAGCGDSMDIASRDHESKIKILEQRCAEQHIVLNEAKKQIGLEEIKFHGHTISREGVKADSTKIDAILKMSSPTDISGVKRLCGMVQYMAKFVPDLATILEPIRALTRKDATWNWSRDCELAFQEVKRKLTETPILSYFDPDKPLVLQVDSSKTGLGAVLLQDQKPIEFASRTLSTSERKWAQIEKEALAILFGLQRFDQYTYGRKVTIQNDHKPLKAILGKPLSSAPRRLQDIMMNLNRYDIEFEFVPGKDLVIADTLSRAHLSTTAEELDYRPRIMNVNMSEDIPDSRIQEVKDAIMVDTDMQDLITLILEGWPTSKNKVSSACKPYFDIRDVLSYADGVVVKGEAIVIPKALRKDIKSRLHGAHVGYDSMMRRARGTVFWPNMSTDIRQIADMCEACQEMKPRNHKETLKQQSDGGQPWYKIGVDLFEIQGRNYLVSIDYYTNFIEVDYLSTTTSSHVVNILKKQFARFGIPAVIVSDGGPQFSARDFKDFTVKWKITHTMCSPGHQQTNGKAESAVKIVKHMMIKTLKDGGDQFESLLEQRNTPRQDTGLSPTQMMFGRTTRTTIPEFRDKPCKIRKRKSRRKSVKKHYDKSARDLPQLQKGQSVYFQHKQNVKWQLGKIVKVLSDRSYSVQSESGAMYRRNRIHVRPTKIRVNIRDQSPVVEKSRNDMCETSIKNNVLVNGSNVQSRVDQLDSRDSEVKANVQISDSVSIKPEIVKPTVRSPDTLQSLIPPTPTLLCDRPKRVTRKPAYLKDYV